MIKRNIISTLIAVFCLTSSSLAWSAMCGYAPSNSSGNGPLVASIPLQASTITVGRDVPLGKEVLRQTFQVSGKIDLQCDREVWANIQYALPTIPLGKSSWVGSPYAGNVYKTDVPGIGVAITHLGTVMPSNRDMVLCSGNVSQCTNTITSFVNPIVLSFIKIGEVAPSTISGASLPTIRVDVTEKESGNRITLGSFSYVGAVNVVSATCLTPDVPVNLGSHQIGAGTLGPEKTTPFVAFDIVLSNCPAFAGYAAEQWSSAGTGQICQEKACMPSGMSATNSLRFRLDPMYGSDFPTKGIVKLDGVEGSATGVGIEISRPAGGSVVPIGTFVYGPGVTGVDGATYKIPLRARYVQTESKVTPGPANSSVMFTIDYQ
ncbi:Pilin (type 1 fimbria component protein) [Pseudomonas delhiensis]|uniref:Pilin (Type 1 fimbria component protein) n=1 Tax=Pseudomonas delhiensis TaxID=366289 RepID=A0A239KDY4_9PSED|nr:fimbrial protein [Pseudomonas delhiensis]SDJ30712.1 Pilin (type 1 fimbria component protein) [Pseudomonas delhiensis]SNT15922.1 Pilin (type 1 fimbria component protein) [Pseudomonas delhiensis]